MKIKLILVIFVVLSCVFQVSSIETTAEPHLDIATRYDSTVYSKFINEFVSSELGQSLGFTDSSQITVRVPTTYEGFTSLIDNDLINVDIAWGGGSTLFNNLQHNGYLEPITDQSVLDWIATNISDTIAGVPMKSYNDTGYLAWVANGITSYGITVNNQVLLERGLPTPQTWEDLASPDYFTSNAEYNIALGNAPDSSSSTRIYQIILQHFGWEKGWEIITAIAANSRIYGGSVETRSSVVSGANAAGLAIDFYGLIAQEENPNCEYIVPVNSTTIEAEPIAITRDAGNLDAANAFIKFVLGERGQSLWLSSLINHLPIRNDAFEYVYSLGDAGSITLLGRNIQSVMKIEKVYNDTVDNHSIEFNDTLAFLSEATLQYLFEAIITNVHSDLRTEWTNLISALDEGIISLTQFLDFRSRLGEVPITLAQAQDMDSMIVSDSSFRLTKQSEWQDFALDKFDQFAQPSITKSPDSALVFRLNENIALEWVIEDNNPDSVQFYLNGTNYGDGTWNSGEAVRFFEWNNSLSLGVYNLTAVFYDSDGFYVKTETMLTILETTATTTTTGSSSTETDTSIMDTTEESLTTPQLELPILTFSAILSLFVVASMTRKYSEKSNFRFE